MKIKLIQIGKTDNSQLKNLIEVYQSRIKQFVTFESIVIQDIKNAKNLSSNIRKQKEGELILSKLPTSDFVILLDEKGREFSSREFADFLQKRMNSGIKNLVFVIGGAYGFSEAVYKRANQKIALSKMTFSHQLIRLIFAEQLYRAYAIINNHPYHND